MFNSCFCIVSGVQFLLVSTEGSLDISHPMTLEEAEDLTSSTLSDSTQRTLSNVSSQHMSMSMHSEVSVISHLSETEKHEMEDTIESETEEYAKGFEEMPDSVSEDETGTVTIDEKCVAEMRDSEKHVRFPRDDATTDVLYTNEQLSQSAEGFIDASDSDSTDLMSSVFAHCAVDELSRGRPKERLSEEVKEASSLTSSVLTEEGSQPTKLSQVMTNSEQSLDEDSNTPRVATPTEHSLHAEGLNADPNSTMYVRSASPSNSSSNENLPESKVDLGDFNVLCANGIELDSHQALSYTSSLEVQASLDVHSLHSDDHDFSPSSTSDQLAGKAPSESTEHELEHFDDNATETGETELSSNDSKAESVVTGLACGQTLILADVSLVSKGIVALLVTFKTNLPLTPITFPF